MTFLIESFIQYGSFILFGSCAVVKYFSGMDNLTDDDKEKSIVVDSEP